MRLSSRPPLARITIIDQAIRAGDWPNASSLGNQLEVSPRTIQRDLVFLRDQLKAPLAFDPVRNGYCYTQADYQLPFFRLTEGELVALFLADRLLRQYRGTPYEEDLRRAFAKITQFLPDAISINLAAVADSLSVTPTVLAPQNIEVFRILSSAVVTRKRLQLEYWTASRNELNQRRVDPYHLTLIDSDWFLIGYCYFRQSVRMFSAVRVRSVRETGETFDPPGDFRVDHYLGDSFRSVRGEGRYPVALRFTSACAGRIAEKVWHRSQKIERNGDGSLILRLELSDLREIKRWVQFWGSECEVLEPDELPQQVREELRRTLESYG
jgi:predicted DNA-binding transcriptional regulator YafY